MFEEGAVPTREKNASTEKISLIEWVKPYFSCGVALLMYNGQKQHICFSATYILTKNVPSMWIHTVY